MKLYNTWFGVIGFPIYDIDAMEIVRYSLVSSTRSLFIIDDGKIWVSSYSDLIVSISSRYQSISENISLYKNIMIEEKRTEKIDNLLK